MEINLELLKKICNRYGATLIENKPGGFIFDNDEYSNIFSNSTSKEEFLKFFKLDFCKEEIKFNDGFKQIGFARTKIKNLEYINDKILSNKNTSLCA